MINKEMRDYAENVIHNKENNYEKILTKAKKGDDNMKITLKKLVRVAAVFVLVLFVGTLSTKMYAKIKWDIEFKEFQARQVGEAKGSLEIAKESDYAEVINMDYVKQDGISVKIDSLLITDDCFDANVSFKFDENVQVDSQQFSYGFAVYDENKNVYEIFTRMHIGENIKKDLITPFMYKEIGVKYNEKDIYAAKLSDRGSIGRIEVNEDARTLVSNFTCRAQDKFPRSKKIYIRVFDLGYSMLEFDENKKPIGAEDFKLSNSEWFFEIDVPEKFYERETLELEPAEEIPEIEFTKITLTEVGLVLNFKSEKYMDLIARGKDMDSGEFREAVTNMLNITDEEGNIYQEIGGGTTGEENGFKMTLDASKRDLLEKKIFINYNVDGKQYKVELVKKQEKS